MPHNPPHDPTSLSALQRTTPTAAPDLSPTNLAPRTVAITHYGLTHPKAYIGYTIALAAANTATEATALTEEHIVGAPAKARNGAINLGLVHLENTNPDTATLTETGQTIQQHAINTYGSLQNALDQFNSLRGSTTRLTILDNWGTIAPDIVQNDPTATHLIDTLQTIHTERNDTHDQGIPLPALVHELYYEDPAFAVQLLIRDSNHIRNQLDDLGTFNHDLLQNANAYRGAGVYQFKNVLYHLGVLTERGADTASLTPQNDIWALEPDWRAD